METLVIKNAKNATNELVKDVFESTFNCIVLSIQCIDKKDSQGTPLKIVYIEVDFSREMNHFIEQIKTYGYDYVNYGKNSSWKVTLLEPKRVKQAGFIPRIIY